MAYRELALVLKEVADRESRDNPRMASRLRIVVKKLSTTPIRRVSKADVNAIRSFTEEVRKVLSEASSEEDQTVVSRAVEELRALGVIIQVE